MMAKKRTTSSSSSGKPDPRYQLNLRVSDLAKELLHRIADKHGLSLTHALEYSIRAQARAEGVYDLDGTQRKL
jgi:hypothetical protein